MLVNHFPRMKSQLADILLLKPLKKRTLNINNKKQIKKKEIF